MRSPTFPARAFVHLDDDLSGPKTGKNGRHPLPDPAMFCARLGALGIDNDKQVVAYDASGGCYAARLWWMLRWVGHDRVAVLDGGWDAWIRAGRPVTARSTRSQARRRSPARRDRGSPWTRASSLAHLQSAGRCVLDARSADRFRGENETLDPVGGHIPGARQPFLQAQPRRRRPLQAGRRTAARNSADLARRRAAGAHRAPVRLRASPPATTCWRWKSPGSPARASIPARGASGSAIPRVPSRKAAPSVKS